MSNFEENPDKEVVEMIRKGLKQTGGYCPCELEKTQDNVCPCKTYRETDECRCGLYV
jgi:ferredoxin-thioredoxin reductase catalytic subunit